MSVEYTLTDLEQKICSVGAKMRYVANRKAGVEISKVAPNSHRDVEVIGLAGELAVARYLNIYPDLTTFIRKGGTDLVTHDGKHIDVKSTFYHTGKMISQYKYNYDDVDLFVLVTTKYFPKVVIRGWTKKKELINEDKVGNLGYGKVFCMEQKELRNINLLLFNPKLISNKIPEMYPDNSKDDLSGYRI